MLFKLPEEHISYVPVYQEGHEKQLALMKSQTLTASVKIFQRYVTVLRVYREKVCSQQRYPDGGYTIPCSRG